MPDEGQIKWQRGVKIGYLDQYAQSAHDLTIGAFLESAFQDLFDIQAKQAQCYTDYALNLDESLLEQAGRYQEILEAQAFYDIQTKIAQVMTGLGIDALGPNRQVSACSGGQRAKIILAKLLLEQSDVLLLDEPTNHLDDETKKALREALIAYPGNVLLVTHEPHFYQDWVDKIFDVEQIRLHK